jgi:WD40 repeat protein
MNLSPDGSTFVTFERLSGEPDRGGVPKRYASLWDIKTGQYRPLPAGINYLAVFTPDGRTLAAPDEIAGGRTNTIKLIDVASAKERVSIPLGEKEAGPGYILGYIAIAPDSKLLVGDVRAKTGSRLGLWEPATGRAVGSFAGGQNDVFLYMAFSPDSRTLAVTNWARSGQSKLFLFDLPGRRLVKTLLLAEKAIAHRPVFRPDGKWIAVPTQEYPDDLRRDLPVEELPQPRIHLIDVAARVVRETWIAPQGFATSACFSPDGRTLATGGSGRVLLWDMTGLVEPTPRK